MVMQQRVQMGGASQDLAVAGRGRVGGHGVGKGIVPAAGQRKPAVRRRRIQRVQKLRVVQIVRVAERKPFGPQCPPLAHTRRAGRADTAVGLVQRHKALVARRDGIAERGGVVGGAVFHKNAPETVKFLGSNRVGAGGQERRRIMYRYDDCDLTGLHGVTSA